MSKQSNNLENKIHSENLKVNANSDVHSNSNSNVNSNADLPSNVNVNSNVNLNSNINSNCNSKSNLNSNDSVTETYNSAMELDKSKKLVKNEILHVMSCSDKHHNLPIMQLKFGKSQISALIDTGANVSLIVPSVIDQIKETCKVEYISRAVRIHTLNNSSIPYSSAVNIKFKIENKWFDNQFFVTQANWNSQYQIILGYDFLQRNKILLDTANKALIIGKDKFSFDESSPKSKLVSNVFARIVNNVRVKPNSSKIIKLNVSNEFKNCKFVNFIPFKTKKEFNLPESIHSIENKSFFTIVENKSNKNVFLRKNSKLGKITEFDESEIVEPDNEESYQVNVLNMQEILKLRKEELTESDFELSHLSETDRKTILDLLMKNSQIFSKSYNTLGSTDAVIPEFNLLHKFPIQTRPYPIPKIAKDFAKREISQLLEAGIIEPSCSSYNFPVIFVKKKPLPGSDSKNLKFRMVVDYRLLNSITETFQICLPKISEILHQISGKNYYCVLDLKSAFFQIQLKKSDRHKLAFCCDEGNFQPKRLFFGSKNSTSYFHTLISKCINDLKGPNVQYFLDDIIVAANSIAELIEILQTVFDRLSKFNLTLDPQKLQLCQSNITYLGFHVNKDGFSPSESNINKVTRFPIPKNVKQVQTFLGMSGYFRHLILNYAEIVQPIVNLTKKTIPFVWSDACQQAFNKIQDDILNRPTLKNLDDSKPLYLVCDASKIAICGILMQKCNNKFVPVEFFSKQLSPAESRYPSIRRELFAIFASCRHFYEQLYGKKFTILTDAKPLTFHMQLDKQPDIVARWLLYLDQFNYDINHIPGIQNPSDFLSRMIVEEHSINVKIPRNLSKKNSEMLNSNLNSNENSFVVNNTNIFEVRNTLERDNIIKHQNSDKEIQEIINKIKSNDSKTKEKYFIDSHSNLVKIKIKVNSKDKSQNSIINKILIPKSLIKDCLTLAHIPHFGTEKTYNFIKNKYHWQGMFLDTKSFCENCSQCMMNKAKPKLTKTENIPKKYLAPGEYISIDLVGKLPRSIDGKFFILTIIDQYSRFLEAIPLADIKSSSIIKHLMEYFSKFGIPKIILSDNGTSFTSNEFTDFLKRLKIEHRKSSIYYAPSNGLLERSHRTMKESIAAISNETFEWSKNLLLFKLHYNNSLHSATKFTPAKIFFGRELNIPLKIFDDPKLVESIDNYNSKIEQLNKKISEEIAENEQQYFAAHSNEKGRNKPNLSLGDKVFVEEFLNSGIFRGKYNGPWVIAKIFRNHNYLISREIDGIDTSKKVHVSKLFLQKPLRPNLEISQTNDS